MGICYFYGIYFEQNYDKAFDYFSESHKQNVQSLYMLGVCYFEGRGVEKDINMGLWLIEKSANKKNPEAGLKIAKIYSIEKYIKLYKNI